MLETVLISALFSSSQSKGCTSSSPSCVIVVSVAPPKNLWTIKNWRTPLCFFFSVYILLFQDYYLSFLLVPEIQYPTATTWRKVYFGLQLVEVSGQPGWGGLLMAWQRKTEEGNTPFQVMTTVTHLFPPDFHLAALYPAINPSHPWSRRLPKASPMSSWGFGNTSRCNNYPLCE